MERRGRQTCAIAPTIPHVSRDELRRMIEGGAEFVLLDALSPTSYARSHLPGAISIPPERVDALAGRRIPDRHTEIIVYCSSSTCASSITVARRLLELGYRTVRHYAEGKRDWIEAGLPLEASGA